MWRRGNGKRHTQMHSSSFESDRVLVELAVSPGERLLAGSKSGFAECVVHCSARGAVPAVAGLLIGEDVYCLTVGQNCGHSIFKNGPEFKLIQNLTVLLRGSVETLRNAEDPLLRGLSARLLPELLSLLPISSHEHLEMLERLHGDLT